MKEEVLRYIKNVYHTIGIWIFASTRDGLLLPKIICAKYIELKISVIAIFVHFYPLKIESNFLYR